MSAPVDAALATLGSVARPVLEGLESDVSAAYAEMLAQDADQIRQLQQQAQQDAATISALQKASSEVAQSAFPGFEVIPGDLTLKDAGDIRHNVVVMGKVTRAAKGCGLVQSIVLGPCINLEQSGMTGDEFLIEDVTVRPLKADVLVTAGIYGNNFRAIRPRISGVVDGIRARAKPSGPGDCNVYVEDPRIGNLAYFASDPAQGGTPVHGDPIQYEGGDGFELVGGVLDAYSIPADGSTHFRPVPGATDGRGYSGSGFMLNENVKDAKGNYMRASNWSVKGTVFHGGYAQINLNPRLSPLVGSIAGTIHGRDVFENYPPRSDKRWICLTNPAVDYAKVAGLYTEAHFEDTGALLTLGRATGIRAL